MRGTRAKDIRKKLRKAGVVISSDLVMTHMGAMSSKGRKTYQAIKKAWVRKHG